MALDETDLDALVAEAAAILDEAARPFVEGHRAESAVQKKGNDFATEVDLAIERQVVEALDADDRDRGARRGVRRRRRRLTAGVGARPDRRHVQLRGGLADGGDPARPGARR